MRTSLRLKRGLKGVVVPSKMYGILAAGKPIVAVAPKETDVVSLGAKQGFAVAADPDKPGGPGERCSRFDCGRQKDESHGRSGAGCCAASSMAFIFLASAIKPRTK